jgi:deoxyribodipyrimidine photo-lyase
MWSCRTASGGVRGVIVRVVCEPHRAVSVSCRHLFHSTKRTFIAADSKQDYDPVATQPPSPAPLHTSGNNRLHTTNPFPDGGSGGGADSDASYPDYFFGLHPHDNESAAAPPPPCPSVPSPPPPPPPATELSAKEWVEFQQYLRQVEEADPEFLAYADGFTPPVAESADKVATMSEALHLLKGTPTSTSLPAMWMEDVEELEQDLAQEDEADAAQDPQLGARVVAPSAPHTRASDDFVAKKDQEDVDGDFGDDAETDAQLLATLRGRVMRLQNEADTVPAPLLIPFKDGSVVATPAATPCPIESSLLDIPRVKFLSSQSLLVQQDRMYLSGRTPAAAQLRPPSSVPAAAMTEAQQCVLVVFSSNDLRVHDNYLLALASVRARTALASSSSSHSGTQHRIAAAPPLPVIAVCVLDYRTFAQPSVVGGFFRQSPQRAQFMLDTVAALRRKLEGELHVPLIVRCGRPEEHVPRLAVELGAADVFMTTQYAPHERRVQTLTIQRLRRGVWVSREAVADDGHNNDDVDALSAPHSADEDPLVAVVEHTTAHQHPYGEDRHQQLSSKGAIAAGPPVVHSVWQTTLVHLDDLPTPLAAMKEGERWYHDDVTVSTIRPTEPYDKSTQQLAGLPMSWQQRSLLPSREEKEGRAPPSLLRGALPTLEDLGYAAAAARGTDFAFEEVIATQSSHPTAGEEAAIARLQDWLAEDGMTSLLRFGRERRTNTKMYSQKLARASPYIAVGALSPRKYYEVLRAFAHDNLRDGFVQQQFREGLLRLSRRDYWHWMGLRFGDRLFFSYGPHPEQTDDMADWRHDVKVVQRWCNALTGIPFADAAMRELVGTGFVAHEGRQALAWLLTRGYGQDWRIGAEWMERCSLDYDPFVCYGNFAYYSGLMLDDFGEPVRNVHYLAHHHDQTGIYIKKWLPQLSKVPPVYIHRPHVLTPRMQAMHNVYLGRNYPYPLKLWQGAQRTLTAAELTAYYAEGIRKGPGYAEALRYGSGVLQPEELSAAVTPAYVKHRTWASMLPASAFADVPEAAEHEEVMARAKSTAFALAGATSAGTTQKNAPQVRQARKEVV